MERKRRQGAPGRRTTNGTFVNDIRNGRISKVPLKDGDVVIVAEPGVLSLQLELS